MDGIGLRDEEEGNAFKRAETPNLDSLMEEGFQEVEASGPAVGLPEGYTGNSEVGHLHLGAGRVVKQRLKRINEAIQENRLREKEALKESLEKAEENSSTVHLAGIISDGGIHGHIDHLKALMEIASGYDVDVKIHCFTDGRDVGPKSAQKYISQIESWCEEYGGEIATVMGRYYAMDRDNRWERVEQAYNLLTGRNDALPNFATPSEAIQDYYNQPVSANQQGDEFITPRTVGADWYETRITNDESVIFYNYRGDRPREIVRAFAMDDFQGKVAPSPDSGARGFGRGRKLNLHYVTMTGYEQELNAMVHVAFPKPEKMADIAGAHLAGLGKTQLRTAETEKFPHVTFFFNDYREDRFEGENRRMAQSPKVATYDLQPAMSAEQVRDDVVDRLSGDSCEDFILVNFANGDMVGHTGKLEAAINAIETVDQCVAAIVDATLRRGGNLIVTADHGNAEQMWNPETEAPHTAHTLYDVPCIVVDDRLDKSATQLRESARLADVMPTCLTLMNLDQPEAMSGQSLLASVTA